jgi:alkaline phosphatase D
MHVEVATTESFANPRRLAPVNALPEGDFAAKLLLEDLPSDQEIFYRVSFADLNDVSAVSEPIVGRLPHRPCKPPFGEACLVGRHCRPGLGIDESRGGMTTYATMLSHDPDFFLHSGDTVYCDGPIAAEKEMPNGEVWQSIVAEGWRRSPRRWMSTRGRFKYNMLDQHVRAFNAAVPRLYPVGRP